MCCGEEEEGGREKTQGRIGWLYRGSYTVRCRAYYVTFGRVRFGEIEPHPNYSPLCAMYPHFPYLPWGPRSRDSVSHGGIP